MLTQTKLFELMMAGILLTMISVSVHAQTNCSTKFCDERARFMAGLRGNNVILGEGSSTLIIERVSAKQTSALAPGSILIIKGPSGIREVIVPYSSKIRLKLPKDPTNAYKIQVVDPNGLVAETDANTYTFKILNQDATLEPSPSVARLNPSTNDQVLLEVTKNSNQQFTYTYDTLPTKGEYFEQLGVVLTKDNVKDKNHNVVKENFTNKNAEPALQGILGQ